MKHSPVPIPGRAPEEGVKLVDRNGERSFKIGDYRGKYVVLLFYSGDWECKDNIMAFEKLLDKYKNSKCEVFACSTDSAKVHQSWIRTPSSDGGFGGTIRIPLISDSTGSMSQKYDVFDPEEGICRNAVVIIDDVGIVRHAMTTSMEHMETAQNCLDIVAMLKQHKLSDSEVRNINAKAKASSKNRSASQGVRIREISPVKLDPADLERTWDVSTDPELAKVLNLAKMLGRAAPPPPVTVKKEPKFEMSVENLRRIGNPKTGVRACRASLQRNLAGFTAPTLGKNQKLQIESLVEKFMGVAYMPEDLTGQYHRLYLMNQREQIRLFEEEVFLNSGDIRLREPKAATWTDGSGVFINNYNNFLIFVNYKDQLKISSVENGTDVRTVLLRLKRAMESMEEALKSLTKRGFTTKDGKFVHSQEGIYGDGFDFSFIVEYPGFQAEGDKTLKSMGIKCGLNVQKYGRRDGLYEVRVSQRPDDSVMSIIKRGVMGIDMLGMEEENLKKKHNIKPSLPM